MSVFRAPNGVRLYILDQFCKLTILSNGRVLIDHGCELSYISRSTAAVLIRTIRRSEGK